MNTVPGDQSATVNQPVVFSTDNGNAIQVSDTDSSAAADQANQLVFSSSFENPNIGLGNVSGGGNGGGNQGGWNLMTWDGLNESALASNGSVYGNPDTTDGSQVLVVQGNATAWQDVTFTEAGKYTLSFLAAYTSNTQGGGWGAGVNPFAVQIDGVTVGTFTPGSNDHFDAYQTDSFTVAAGVHRVSFVGLTNDGSDRVSFVDQVSITKVADVLQVNLAVDNGTLTLAHTDGLAFLSGDGVNDSSMTFLGSQTDINAALDGLQFMPATVDFVGTANVQITTSDLAAILAGGPKITTDTVAINASLPSDFSGLLGAYYSNLSFTGTPVYRIDPTINFDWGNQGSPAPGIVGSGWAARWQGEIQAQDAGTYQFRVTADDGAALYVNSQLVCSPTNGSGTGSIELDAGQSYSFEFDYCQGGGENAKVEWMAPGQSDWQVIPASQLSCAKLAPAREFSPVNNVPQDTQNGVLNTPFIFSAEQGNGVSVSDPGVSYDQQLQVTLSTDHGTITLGGTNGLNFTAGDGTDDATHDLHRLGKRHQRRTGRAQVHAERRFPWDRSTHNHHQRRNRRSSPTAGGNPQPIRSPSTCRRLRIIKGSWQPTKTPTARGRRSFASIRRSISTGEPKARPPRELKEANWIATWQGTVTPDATGDYTFYATADGGVRLWIDGNLVCDGSANQGPAEFSNEIPIHMEAGEAHTIRMDYFQNGGGESAKLEWSSDSMDRQVIQAHNLSCADLIQHENAAPVNNMPADQTLGINAPLIFSSAHGNAITVGDPDVDPSTLVRAGRQQRFRIAWPRRGGLCVWGQLWRLEPPGLDAYGGWHV